MKNFIIPESITDQISQETKDFLAMHFHPKTVEKGQQFLWEGDPLDAVYMIVQGYVKVFHLSDGGREQVLMILKEGNFVNTVSALQVLSFNHAHASALGRAVVGKMALADFNQAIHEYSDFALLQMRDLAVKLSHMTDLVSDLSLRSTRQRLIQFLLQNDTQQAVVSGWTQEEIAAQIGTVRDVVSRLLGLFSREGLIRIERQRIILLDDDRLRSELERIGNAT